METIKIPVVSGHTLDNLGNIAGTLSINKGLAEALAEVAAEGRKILMCPTIVDTGKAKLLDSVSFVPVAPETTMCDKHYHLSIDQLTSAIHFASQAILRHAEGTKAHDMFVTHLKALLQVQRRRAGHVPAKPDGPANEADYPYGYMMRLRK